MGRCCLCVGVWYCRRLTFVLLFVVCTSIYSLLFSNGGGVAVVLAVGALILGAPSQKNLSKVTAAVC